MKLIPILVAATLATLAAAEVPRKSIELERRPPKKGAVVPADVTSAFQGKHVAIELTDARGVDDPAIVGAQTEGKDLIYEWKSATPVVVSVAKMIEQTLKAWKVDVQPAGETKLGLSLAKFRCNEVSEMFGSSYRGEVDLAAGGKSVQGVSKRPGPDQRASICNEVLTSALEDALGKLLGGAAVTTAAAPAVASSLLDELVKMQKAGLGEEVLVGYVRQHPPRSPLSADDLIAWKEKGLSDFVIRTAQETTAKP